MKDEEKEEDREESTAENKIILHDGDTLLRFAILYFEPILSDIVFLFLFFCLFVLFFHIAIFSVLYNKITVMLIYEMLIYHCRK